MVPATAAIDDADLLRCGATSRVLGHEVHGYHKQGAAYDYTRKLGYHPLLASRADSGFWSAKTIWACRRHGICYSITVRQTKPIRAAIATMLHLPTGWPWAAWFALALARLRCVAYAT